MQEKKLFETFETTSWTSVGFLRNALWFKGLMVVQYGTSGNFAISTF